MVHNQDMCELILRVRSSEVWFRDGCGLPSLCYQYESLLLPIAGGGYNISPMKPRNGRPRTQVQHLIQIDLKGWGVGYVSSFQQHCLLQMLNSVAGEILQIR